MVGPIEALDDQTWRLESDSADGVYRRCANLESPAGCNWLVPNDDPQQLCVSCRLNRTIPDLSIAENRENWARIEIAKRRLISAVVALGLPIRSRLGEDPERGLAFDFLHTPAQGPTVLTGHENGIITLNIEEADDATREKIREQFHESYRTLLGHLRHEIGHYYWDRLIPGTSWHARFRALFGDESQDYSAMLAKHYASGPPADWPDRYVSAYASAHPWEDWAETWAHYLHLVDTSDVALSFGVNIDGAALEFERFTADSLFEPEDEGAEEFLTLVNGWTRLTAVLNEFSRSMGQPDFYPFILPRSAVAKLQFVHLLIEETRGRQPES